MGPAWWEQNKREASGGNSEFDRSLNSQLDSQTRKFSLSFLFLLSINFPSRCFSPNSKKMEESSEEAARHHFTFNSLYLPNITQHFYSERSHSQRGGTETVLIYSCESFSAWIKHPPWLQRTKKKKQYLFHWHNSATRLINLLWSICCFTWQLFSLMETEVYFTLWRSTTVNFTATKGKKQ